MEPLPTENGAPPERPWLRDSAVTLLQRDVADHRRDDPRVAVTPDERAVLGAREITGRPNDQLRHRIDADRRIGQRLHDRADRGELFARVRRQGCLYWGLLRARPHGRSIGAFTHGGLVAAVTWGTNSDCSSKLSRAPARA